MSRLPRTREEWQEASDVASFLLHLDSARQYGLISGGPTGNLERCEEILRLAKKRGLSPAPIDELCQRFFKPSAAG